MIEQLVKIEKSKAMNKKYAAIVFNKITKKLRRINFGDSRYENFKDSTGLGLFTSKNHGDRKRRKAYFMRHSGVSTKIKAVKKERLSGKYSAKLLSHMFLW